MRSSNRALAARTVPLLRHSSDTCSSPPCDDVPTQHRLGTSEGTRQLPFVIASISHGSHGSKAGGSSLWLSSLLSRSRSFVLAVRVASRIRGSTTLRKALMRNRTPIPKTSLIPRCASVATRGTRTPIPPPPREEVMLLGCGWTVLSMGSLDGGEDADAAAVDPLDSGPPWSLLPDPDAGPSSAAMAQHGVVVIGMNEGGDG
jgi:hypothetical protein